MNEPVDTRLNFNESSERGEITHLAGNACADGVFHRQHHPRILLGLLHAQGDLLFRLIHLEHHGFDGLADRNDGRRMAHRPRPTHLANVDQPLDARLQFHKGAVVRNADDLAL